MSINEDLVQPTSDSFWEIGKYSRTVKRIDNGKHLSDSLRSLIESRSEIEKNYAKQLAQWSKRWNDFLDKGSEYGTTQGGWRGLCTEADSVADLHNLVAENLMTKVYTSIKAWQKENYHKSMMHFKETKELEEGFKKAQKPWEKKYTKVMQSRKDYHAACKSEKSTANQENNARGDSAVSPDQLKKIQEKLRKCQQEVEGTRDKYQASLNDLNSYNAKYIEDMTEVFQKCQDFEKIRIEFFKKTLFEIHQHLDLSCETRFSQVYTNLHNTISQVDSDKDLRWWSNNNGADMAMNWPTFEEYSPDLQTISRKEKKNSQIGSNDGITITSIRHKPDAYIAQTSTDSYNSQRSSTVSTGSNNQQSSTVRKISFDGFPSLRRKSKDTPKKSPRNSKPDSNTLSKSDSNRVPQPPDSARLAQIDTNESQVDQMTQQNKTCVRLPSYDESLNPFGEDEEPHVYQAIDEAKEPNKEPEPKTNNIEETTNPFGDDADDDPQPEPSPEVTPREDSKEGIPVRALYDYVVTEEDELPLKAGDVFVKLSEEDELGWCKGFKDGREGLYPANYVEPV